jgi:ribonucleoside-diphosphate reductase beta chain
MTTENQLLNSTYTNLFFGEGGAGLSRHDVARYPILEKLNDKMQSFFWRPVEIDMSMEKKDFQRMTATEKFVFTSNLRRQILLDSIQGRAPSLAFLPICTDPQLEACIQTWSFFEEVHSQSYGHIIRAIYPDPSSVFEEIPQITEIADCAASITAAYDRLQETPSKENLYLALIAANALEALRFYVSFACTFSFAERGLVEGSAKVVRFIARDEAQHLALVQHVLKLLPKDDPEFAEIAERLKPRAIAIFKEAADQEKQWIKYLFKDGTVLGLSEKILTDYVDYLLNRRLAAIGLASTNRMDHPLPWVEKWYSSANVQVAPQEVEVASYLTGSVINDVADVEFTL